MSEASDITESAIRQHVLDRAAAYCAAHKTSFSKISGEATRDEKFLSRVQAGENFTVKSYQKVLDWLDRADRRSAA